jgi:hypothetical protein
MDTSRRQKISKEIIELNTIINYNVVTNLSNKSKIYHKENSPKNENSPKLTTFLSIKCTLTNLKQ